MISLGPTGKAFHFLYASSRRSVMQVFQTKMNVWMAMFALMVVVGCAGYSTGGGGGNPHVAEAITHAQEAADHGGMGHADAVVTHAEVSLQHAQAAAKEMTNPHLAAGIAELGEAIAHGKAGHADVATKHANSAVMHLKEISGSSKTDSNY
jgi:hypothetical protein